MAAKLQLVLCVAMVVLGTALAKWQPSSEDEKRAVMATKVAVLHEQLQVTCLTTWSLPLHRLWCDVWDWASALQPHSHTRTSTITCACCYNVISGIQDLKNHSHADSPILSQHRCRLSHHSVDSVSDHTVTSFPLRSLSLTHHLVDSLSHHLISRSSD